MVWNISGDLYELYMRFYMRFLSFLFVEIIGIDNYKHDKIIFWSEGIYVKSYSYRSGGPWSQVD